MAHEAGGSAFEETGAGRVALPVAAGRARPADVRPLLQRPGEPGLWFLAALPLGPGRAPNLDPELHQAWAGLPAVNEAFAAAVARASSTRTRRAVWFHDYHLYLAPRLVRERAPDATLSHFSHIPWPSPDYWRVLPEDHQARRSTTVLLANDLVSFHTERWCRNFLRCCEAILGATSDFSAGRVTYQGRRSLVHARPISRGSRRVRRACREPELFSRRRRRSRTGARSS